MFGLDNKDNDKKDDAPSVQPAPAQPVNNGLLGIDDDDQSTAMPATGVPAVTPEPATNNSDPLGAPTLPSQDEPATPSEPASVTDADDDVTAPEPPDLPTGGTNDELLDIKREALQELSPLIDHLDQTADEKFRTTMMMIQAADNQALIPQAFAAAKQITDDKKRAQALLDVVNEINYFTQKENS